MKNDYWVNGDDVWIELRKKNSQNVWTVIDLDDLSKLEEIDTFLYSAWDKKRKQFYCGYNDLSSVPGKRTRKTHKLLTNCPMDMVVDHIDRNPLNNRSCNLRVVTVQANTMNTDRRGITFSKTRNRWRARITVNKNTIALGDFKSEEAAHGMYLLAKEIIFEPFFNT